MPELPEVETIARRLNTVLVGQKIMAVEVKRAKSWPQSSAPVIGQTISQVGRRAKIILIQLANELTLAIHLKMTGQLVVVDAHHQPISGGGHPTADWAQHLPGSHTRVIITLETGSQLFFNDQRLFGWIKIWGPTELATELASYGPDANQPAFNAGYLAAKIAHRRVPIKQLLMDNKIVAGIGNIYASEALFKARISPFLPANTLTQTQIENIVTASQQVIAQAIAAGGTTFDGHYLNAQGQPGNYQHQLKVYGRDGQNCLVCGQLIAARRLGGRNTFYCPHCQAETK